MPITEKNKLVFVSCFLACLAYVFLEWLFFVTKPSLFNYVPAARKAAALLLATIPLYCLVLIYLLPLFVLSIMFRNRIVTGTVTVLAGLFSAVVLALAGLLLIDNFTYSVFRFGVVNNEGIWDILYIAILVFFVVTILRHILECAGRYDRVLPGARAGSRALLLFLLLNLVPALVVFETGQGRHQVTQAPDTGARKNILVFSADGLNARHMSLYGYHKPTTPFLDSIRDELLYFENHFSNSSTSTGAIGALLTGKLPTTTRVIYRPDLFTGIHSYQHLPGLLKNQGYYNLDISVRHYLDPVDLNLVNSFDFANGRAVRGNKSGFFAFFQEHYPLEYLFLREMYQRISSRLLDIFNVRAMYDSYMVVTRPEPGMGLDRARLDMFREMTTGIREPFFVHMHLMVTHGPTFPVENQVFSSGIKQTGRWMDPFYEDAILQIDTYFREVMQHLEERGLLDNTLVIFNSDHSYRWSIYDPVPLIFRFPQQELAGLRKINSQRIDIAPTVLDYLQVAVPGWMQGQSLLHPDPDTDRPIVAVKTRKTVKVDGWSHVNQPEPPFYTLRIIYNIYCDTIFRLNLGTRTFTRRKLKYHTADCSGADIPESQEAHDRIMEHLRLAGYKAADT